MDGMVTSTAEPAYLSRLALKRLPFSAADSSSFFRGRQIEQRRYLLLHLLRATRRPVLLQAPPGMGKTTMLTQLQHTAPADLRVCAVDASTDRAGLIMRLLRSVGADLPAQAAGEQLHVMLRQRLLQLRHLHIVPVLLIDDADQLTDEVLAEIDLLLGWQDDHKGGLLQAVFAAARSDRLPAGFQRLDLPPLEQDEVAAYLLHRLQAAGYAQGTLPFTARQLQRFERIAVRSPAAINQLAHQLLLGVEHAPGLSARLPWPFRALLRWSAVIVLVLIVVVVLRYQQQINDWMQADPETVSDAALVTEQLEADVVTGVEIDDKAQARQELAELIAAIPPLQDAGSVPDDAETADGAESAAPVDEADEAETVLDSVVPPSADAQVEAQAPEPMRDDNSGNGATASTGDESVTQGRDWILAQPSTAYTFQLMGAWSQQEVDDYIAQHALDGEIACFVSLRDGRPWHVLIYGVYDSRDAALAASRAWPPPLNALPTWLRRFDSVQQQIREKGVTR